MESSTTTTFVVTYSNGETIQTAQGKTPEFFIKNANILADGSTVECQIDPDSIPNNNNSSQNNSTLTVWPTSWVHQWNSNGKTVLILDIFSILVLILIAIIIVVRITHKMITDLILSVSYENAETNWKQDIEKTNSTSVVIRAGALATNNGYLIQGGPFKKTFHFAAFQFQTLETKGDDVYVSKLNELNSPLNDFLTFFYKTKEPILRESILQWLDKSISNPSTAAKTPTGEENLNAKSQNENSKSWNYRPNVTDDGTRDDILDVIAFPSRRVIDKCTLFGIITSTLFFSSIGFLLGYFAYINSAELVAHYLIITYFLVILSFCTFYITFIVLWIKIMKIIARFATSNEKRKKILKFIPCSWGSTYYFKAWWGKTTILSKQEIKINTLRYKILCNLIILPSKECVCDYSVTPTLPNGMMLNNSALSLLTATIDLS